MNQTNNSQPSMAKEALGLVKNDWRGIIPPTFNFLMVVIATIALGIYYPYSLIISVPFVLIPFFFALQMTIIYHKKNAELSPKQFFVFFVSYFSSPFCGCYRVIRDILWSILWLMVGGFLGGIICYYIFSGVSSDFVQAFNTIISYMQSGDATAANHLFATNVWLQSYSKWVNLIEMTIFFFSFLLLFAFQGPNTYLRLVIVGAPSRVCNAIYKGGVKLAGKEYYKDYFLSLWPLFLIAVVSYVGGCFIGNIFFSNSALEIAVCGASLSVLVLTFFAPYYDHLCGLLSSKYQGAFAQYSINLATSTLRQLEEAKKLSDEEVKSLRDSIDLAQKDKDFFGKYSDKDDSKDDDKDDDDKKS
jgi:hypothetical protein